jgi:hypothetical protein
MTAISSPAGEVKPLRRDLLQAVRYYVRGRSAWIALAALGAGGGFVLNWNWLVAAGFAPLLGVLLPCLAMCGIHLCWGRDCKHGDATPVVEGGGDAKSS